MLHKTCTIIIIVNVFVLGGLAVFVAWLADRMKLPTFSIEHGAMSSFNFTTDNHLNSNFVFVIRSHNRDSKYTIMYHAVAVSVHHVNYTLAFETMGGSYVQHHGDNLVLTAHLTARNVEIAEDNVAGDIRKERRAGRMAVVVRVRASVTFEVKGWKHKHYLLKAECSPVVINFVDLKTISRTECSVGSFSI